eukprot:gnl/MRDRNA2_/MRDRNA2_71018_c0_seq1.p1 gnl/MRDRNA2_/MRDRNA2_71018_c0~~gnl/MRDRNA2_/MRDRNA2_71018_c0_seq1.p1  ORF type:complete len:336 (-),score=58.47 gnl/MRDRNA2_/MRDRNA2_71018_c0_seq1:11-1018(-)
MKKTIHVILLNLFCVTTALRISSMNQPLEIDLWPERVPWPEENKHRLFPDDANMIMTKLKSNANHSWFHHHIWKTGGTNLCQMAINNAEVIPNHSANPCDQCDISSLTEENKITFAQIQHPISEQWLSEFSDPKLGISVMLRNPLDQTLSHYHHAVNDADPGHMTLLEWMHFGICRQREGQDLHPNCLQNLRSSLEERGMTQMMIDSQMQKVSECAHYFFFFEDNIQTRWISGVTEGTVFNSGTSDLIDENALNKAKQNLAKYTKIFILEEFDNRDKARLASQLGWSNLANGNQGTCRHSAAEKELESDILDEMKVFLKQDLSLYEYARALASQQ